MNITVPEKVNEVLSVLNGAGYEAYTVGGCVRDSCLGRTPHDWDITTSATPLQVRELFRRTVDTGIRHGTITVLLGEEAFEVTTYRIDGIYQDGRHPSGVTFTRSLAEDLRRRDFTINAMAYHPMEGMVDLFGGLEDLKNGLIRAVGTPEDRFREDALRIMRAVRFSAQLNYRIETETRKAIRICAPDLKKISAERIRDELEKLLVSDHPGYIREAVRLGLTAVFLPELDECMEATQHNSHHIYTVGEHIIRSVEAVGNDRILRLTMLFHDLAKPECRTLIGAEEKFPGHPEKSAVLCGKIMRRLKFDNDSIRKVQTLVRCHGIIPGKTPAEVRRQIVMVGEELFPLLFEVKLADAAAQKEGRLTYRQEEVRDWKKLYEEILHSGDCLSLKQLAVTGEDLIGAGIRPGRKLGELLEQMLEDVLETPSHNTRAYLMETYVR